ncbi:hypothetical protein Fmac_000137 [Flemingia macrophylla]|uniref:Uncharacterized protein n=1 Tax=Flemingia macrophylla TaxID=520843 RepID=A0ABD1NDD9_9FABA
MMKSNFAVFVVFSLLLVGNFGSARKDMGAYWENMMKEQPMPEAIKDLVEGKNRFVRDFDVKPNVILYHTHAMSAKQKQKQKHMQKQMLFGKNDQD